MTKERTRMNCTHCVLKAINNNNNNRHMRDEEESLYFGTFQDKREEMNFILLITIETESRAVEVGLKRD